MRILIVLTYYRPHISGLTIYAERLAKAFVRRGHQVTVLTSKYLHELPLEEEVDGVRIVRVPIAFRLSKGVIMPSFGRIASRLVKEHDVVQLHLPQFDAAGVALRGRLWKKPTVITYHCDLIMPPGLISWLANQAVLLMNDLAAVFTHRLVTYTRDYGENSPYLRRYKHKLEEISPPVVLPEGSADAAGAFRIKHNPDNRFPVIGMASRFATEKGVEVLLEALPQVFEQYPNAMVQFAGPYENIIGEEEYYERLCPMIRLYQAEGKWKFVGILSPEQMSSFYPNLTMLVMPSLNSTESFGLVQIEAMLNGVPCIASALPGVRQPIYRHKMGKVIPIGDSESLAEAIMEIARNRESYIHNADEIRATYLPDEIARKYEALFDKIKSELK